MGTRRGVCSRSIGDPPRPVWRSVTLDPSSIKRYAGTAMRWLMLLMSLPPTPTRHRVGVWRKLQRMGAVRLRGSAWILPETPETTELFQWLVQEIQSFRGEATLVHVDRIEAMTEEQVRALFHKARGVEYQAVVQGCREILSQLDRYLANHRSVAKLRGTLDGFKRELDRIQTIDYLDTPAGPRARKLWETTATRLRAAETRPRAARGRHRASLPPHGSTWVTRPRPPLDRIASDVRPRPRHPRAAVRGQRRTMSPPGRPRSRLCGPQACGGGLPELSGPRAGWRVQIVDRQDAVQLALEAIQRAAQLRDRAVVRQVAVQLGEDLPATLHDRLVLDAPRLVKECPDLLLRHGLDPVDVDQGGLAAE